MKIAFSQGIVKAPRDANGTLDFLSYTNRKDSNIGQVDLIVASPNAPIVAVAANDSRHYIIEEQSSVMKAWNNLDTSKNQWLYWDIDLIYGTVTRGVTYLEPITSTNEPESKEVDQHWFDLSSYKMRVWDGSQWNTKLRVFAAKIISGNLVNYSLGSQVGINQLIDAGYIQYEVTGFPLRDADGKFITDEVKHRENVSGLIRNNSLESVRLHGITQEPLSAFTFVTYADEQKIVRAINSVVGIVEQDYSAQKFAEIKIKGVVTNPAWDFTGHINDFAYMIDGQISFSKNDFEDTIVLGHVIGTNSIYLNLNIAHVDDSAISINVQGSAGPTGPQGAQGPVGDQGIAGPTGPAGLQGVTGPQGQNGVNGGQGPQGPTGPKGLQGAQGPTGPQGLTGPQGNASFYQIGDVLKTIGIIPQTGVVKIDGSQINSADYPNLDPANGLCSLDYAYDVVSEFVFPDTAADPLYHSSVLGTLPGSRLAKYFNGGFNVVVRYFTGPGNGVNDHMVCKIIRSDVNGNWNDLCTLQTLDADAWSIMSSDGPVGLYYFRNTIIVVFEDLINDGVMSSTDDGVTWSTYKFSNTLLANETDRLLAGGLAYSPDRDIFVLLELNYNQYNSRSKVFVSADLQTWEEHSIDANIPYNPPDPAVANGLGTWWIDITYFNGKFIALPQINYTNTNGGTRDVYSSFDGITWNKITPGYNNMNTTMNGASTMIEGNGLLSFGVTAVPGSNFVGVTTLSDCSSGDFEFHRLSQSRTFLGMWGDGLWGNDDSCVLFDGKKFLVSTINMAPKFSDGPGPG